MTSIPLIECVPNFSEGRDMGIIREITNAIESVEGIRLLDVDPGKATNRTVVTFVGIPEDVVEAAFRAIQMASQVIDMTKHSGEHPRMGATDVCPFVPVAGLTMEEVVQYAHQLGEKAGVALDIPFYMYENAATSEARRNLATVRAGEYEGLVKKLNLPEWKPDYGPARFNPKSGATAIGAREFLIAYNVNLNTTSVRRANSIAFDVREKGRIKRTGNPISGKIVRDEDGNPVRESGKCKSVKAIGWYIDEYGVAQISMNLTNIKDTNLHEAFEACRDSANNRGLRVTGSELVGLVPLSVMLDAGRFFLKKQKRSLGISEDEIIRIAIKSMGLNELSEFDPSKKIIEYRLRDAENRPLVKMNLLDFAHETASESPAPGGGSISAYVGALGASLATMVANLSANKREWDERWEEFSVWAEKGQQLNNDLLGLVDEDTRSFNGIIEAIRLPKNSETEKKARAEAIQAATKYAIEVPFQVMKRSYESFEVIKAMATSGNPNSVSDAGVAALCARAAVKGAFLNVKINAVDLKDRQFAEDMISQGSALEEQTEAMEKEILRIVNEKIT